MKTQKINNVPAGQYMFSEETVKSICKMFVPESSTINNLQEVIDSFKAAPHPVPDASQPAAVPDEAGEGKGWISVDMINDLLKIRNYFGENDKTEFEHWAFDFTTKLLNKLSPNH